MAPDISDDDSNHNWLDRPKRKERVCFVIDGDNIQSSLRREGIPVDWPALKNVINRACIRLQEAHPDHRTYSAVGPVGEAHFFMTVSVPFATGETNNARLVARRLERYRIKAEASLRAKGYTPHVTAVIKGTPGYPDSQIRQLILDRLAYFDTLILASCDNDFWDLLWKVYRHSKRVFYVGTSTRSTSRWRIDNKLPFIDLATLQMVYTQTIYPRPRPRPTPA